jgi:excisionase family DNA binding protein
MKTYSVKQIAKMLGTNPETVRRWIRDDKMKAVQVSRKDGNIVTEAELERFIKATPKYFSKLTAGVGLTAMAPVVGIGALASGIVASALLGYFDGKNSVDVRVRPEDFKEYLQKDIAKLNSTILQKQALIHQTEAEINEISKQIEQYSYLLENEDLLAETLKKTAINMEG